MANVLVCGAVFRIVLPLVMLSCIIFRPSVLSGIYLFLLLVSASVPIPNKDTMSGLTGIFLKILIVISTLTSFASLIFQIVLIAQYQYDLHSQNCENPEMLLRHIGLIKLDHLPEIDVIVFITPELVMFVTSIAFYVIFGKLTKPPPPVMQEDGLPQRVGSAHGIDSKQKNKLLLTLGKCAVVQLLCGAAIIQPSIQGGFYFLVYLSSSTWWAFNRNLGKGFAIVLKFCMLVVFVHIFTIYAYQTQWVQEIIPDNEVRYLRLTAFMSMNCTEPRHFEYHAADAPNYINVFLLMILYFFMATVSRELLEPQLMHTSGSTPRYGTGTRGPTVLQDSTGSVIISSDNPDDIPLKDVPGSDLEEEVAPSLFERLVFVFESILIFVIRTSYIATNIIMMTWSITYHSWLTFVLLLWANIIWMIPHQRQNMLRSSPFLVLYASLLLIASYIYDMDLTDAEIPSKIFNIPLKELGLDKSNNDPSILLVKCLFTSMFWITLRQYMKETRDARNSSVLNDIVAPLEVTVGAAAGVLDPDSEKKGGEMFRKIGEFISQLLTKLWIWIVAITLFLVAITGDRMTGFRILYMALFIIFMLSFQLSFRVWRKMMFGFWLTVIVYSMLVLIMVYTYQFDHFNDYWKKYLHVDYQQQLDIGLEKYETKQLFVRLVTPTVFVIITVIQLHYFHKDFMEMSKPKFGNVTFDTSKSEANSSAQGGLKTMEEDADEEDEESSETTDIENISTKIVRRNLYKLKELLIKFINFLMCYLEIHMQKLVLFVAMLISVMNPCAIYLWIIILVVLGTTIGKTMVDVSIYIISVTSSLLLLTRMLYQIEYIDHNRWNVSCPVKISNGSTIDYDYNDAQWIGLKKIEPGERLIDLVKWDIVYMVTISLWCTLKIRQINYRADRGDYLRRPFFVFPNVKIQDANKSLKNYLKYLVNYFYFRTGVEVSLIALVITIGIHMDFYAIIYAIWLCILFLMRRKTLSRIWNVFVMFTAILIPIQYFIVIGFPPALCFVDFQWTSDVYMQRLQAWVYYNIYYFQPSSARKLLSDFILLLLIARQSLVFRIEARHGSSYIGGNNDIIIHHAEEKDFVNPVPDFITYSRTYLDVLKKATILPFIWITFAVVFLAGANRVNIFSIGYLLGTFHFLWEGSDIYLRPIPLIIKKWNILLSYNVAVISFKVVFQLFGCVFYQYMEENLCVLVQLFGIGCLSKNPELMINIDQEECAVTIENVDVSWDAACFAFLIIQKRIFHSYNFFHLINENKASTILACRGAELIEELRCKRVLEQEETERNVIEKIKLKMDRIKASQQKILGPGSEQGDHKVDTIYPKSSRPMYRRKEPKSYKAAIRSGDYYMFDDIENEKLDFYDDVPIDEEDEYSKATRGPTLGEVRIREIEPQPSTSREDDKRSIITVEKKKPRKFQKVLDYLLFLCTIVEGAMLSAINFMNRFSKDYKYVLRVLSREKKILKESTDYNIGVRMGPNSIWQPAANYKTLITSHISEEDYNIDDITSGHDQLTVIRLIMAAWYIVLTYSDLICYFVIFLNQIKNATLMSLPLPLLVFFWGTLTVPRPSKTFWVTIIAYTQIIVIIKCVCQFSILPWNQPNYVRSFDFSGFIGVEKRNNYAIWDLLLLLVVHLHRFLLTCLGLWKNSYDTVAVLAEGRFESAAEEEESQREDIDVYHSDTRQLVENSDNEDTPVQTSEVEAKKLFPASVSLILQKHVDQLKQFFDKLVDPTSRLADDVYSYMFICDFFNFFVILMGYSSFGSQQEDGGVSSYLEENRVPMLFLLLLIVQFLLIIIDRAIFLRKNLLAKIVFQIFQIISLHIWLFMIFPAVTERRVNTVAPPQMLYMVKCFYLLLSAYQIRSGYPARILGNFLCKGYGYVNMFLFKSFMLIPFLFELRTVMDWMWTDTSMTIFDWIKMEDIFVHIYQLKCSRHIEDEYPQPRGEKKKPTVKYMMGGAALAIIVILIWFPLVFFSLSNAVGKPNMPFDVTINLRLGPYEPLYRMSAQKNSIYQLNENEYHRLTTHYNKNKAASTFLSFYDYNDIGAVKLNPGSATVWNISPPDKNRMILEVESNNTVFLHLQYEVSHETSSKEELSVLQDEVVVEVEAFIDGKVNPVRQNILSMLKGEKAEPTLLQYIMPKFIKVTNRGVIQVMNQLMNPVPDKRAQQYRNITIELSQETDSDKVWWQIKEECDDDNYKKHLQWIAFADCAYLMIYTFNDKVFPSTLSFISGGGIIGLYTTLVFVASRVLRGFFSEICFKIMFDDMPYVDRVFQLCLDVYLVREAGEFALEEDLFAKLVFLYRSPETLIKWTRPQEEVDDDENPEGDEN